MVHYFKNKKNLSINRSINNTLKYKFKTEGRSPKDFNNYQNAIDLFINLRDGNMNSREILKNQIKFKSDMDEIKKGNPKLKSEDQINIIQNIQTLFGLREKIINFFRDYSLLLSEAKYKVKYGTGPKILASKQILQGFPIALAQVKIGNTSKNLLNEIRQVIYPLYQAKEITKKVYNNIINSIKL